MLVNTNILIQSLQKAKSELPLENALNKLSKFQLVILDEFGYIRKNETETSVLFELIAHRYETGSIIITSNQTFEQWDHLFSDQVMAVAAVDRIVHHSTVINIDEKVESYRVTQAKVKLSAKIRE